jgi:hypothetical protein
MASDGRPCMFGHMASRPSIHGACIFGCTQLLARNVVATSEVALAEHGPWLAADTYRIYAPGPTAKCTFNLPHMYASHIASCLFGGTVTDFYRARPIGN